MGNCNKKKRHAGLARLWLPANARHEDFHLLSGCHFLQLCVLLLTYVHFFTSMWQRVSVFVFSALCPLTLRGVLTARPHMQAFLFSSAAPSMSSNTPSSGPGQPGSLPAPAALITSHKNSESAWKVFKDTNPLIRCKSKEQRIWPGTSSKMRLGIITWTKMKDISQSLGRWNTWCGWKGDSFGQKRTEILNTDKPHHRDRLLSVEEGLE